MQKINSIAQSVLKLSHRENADDDDDNDEDTHPGLIIFIVRIGMYVLSASFENRFYNSLPFFSKKLGDPA